MSHHMLPCSRNRRLYMYICKSVKMWYTKHLGTRMYAQWPILKSWSLRRANTSPLRYALLRLMCMLRQFPMSASLCWKWWMYIHRPYSLYVYSGSLRFCIHNKYHRMYARWQMIQSWNNRRQYMSVFRYVCSKCLYKWCCQTYVQLQCLC